MTSFSLGPHVVFLERFAELPAGRDVTIAIRADALVACMAHGVEATVVDDHIDRASVMSDWRDYVTWQIRWIARLDEHARDGSGSARAAALFLAAPLDSLVVHARVLGAVLDSLQPSRVSYVGMADLHPDALHDAAPGTWPTLGNPPLAARLLPLLCEARRLEYVAVDVPFADLSWVSSVRSVAVPIRARARAQIASRIAELRRRRCLTPASVSWPRLARTIAFVDPTYGLRTYAAAEQAAGRAVLLPAVERGRLVLRERRGRRMRVVARVAAGRPEVGVSGVGRLDDLLSEIDPWARVAGAARVIEPRVRRYVDDVCPRVEAWAHAIAPVLDELGVDRVTSANPDDEVEFGALLAATRRGTDRLLLQHGDHVMPYEPWLVTEVQNFTAIACSEPTVPGDLVAAAAQHEVPAPSASLWSPRAEELAALGRSASRPSSPVFCYVPGLFAGDYSRMGRLSLEEAWYARWQLRLLRMLESMPEHQFIWKSFPIPYFSADPMRRVVAKAAPNVRLSTAWLPDELARATHFITDFPSTPLFDARAWGRPVIAIAFTRFLEIRPTVAALLGESLRTCSYEGEAEAAIRGFIVNAEADTPL